MTYMLPAFYWPLHPCPSDDNVPATSATMMTSMLQAHRNTCKQGYALDKTL